MYVSPQNHKTYRHICKYNHSSIMQNRVRTVLRALTFVFLWSRTAYDNLQPLLNGNEELITYWSFIMSGVKCIYSSPAIQKINSFKALSRRPTANGFYINDCQGKQFNLAYCLQIQQDPKPFFSSKSWCQPPNLPKWYHVPYLSITENNKNLFQNVKVTRDVPGKE